MAFSDCSGIKTIELSASVFGIGSAVFTGCSNLTDVYFYGTRLPQLGGFTNQFDGCDLENATLHVSSDLLDDALNASPWKSFGNVVFFDNPNVPQCAAPTISYKTGKLSFASATPGAQIHYEIGSTDALSGSIDAGDVEVSTFITVTAYATAIGYRRSVITTYQVPISLGIPGDLNHDGEVNATDIVEIANIILEKESEQ